MNASCSLLTTLAPAIPEPEGRFADQLLSGPPAATTGSFVVAMLQARRDNVAALPAEAKAVKGESALAATETPTASTAADTALAALVQLQLAGLGFSKSNFSLVNSIVAPTIEKSQPRASTKNSSGGAPAIK